VALTEDVVIVVLAGEGHSAEPPLQLLPEATEFDMMKNFQESPNTKKGRKGGRIADWKDGLLYKQKSETPIFEVRKLQLTRSEVQLKELLVYGRQIATRKSRQEVNDKSIKMFRSSAALIATRHQTLLDHLLHAITYTSLLLPSCGWMYLSKKCSVVAFRRSKKLAGRSGERQNR
jgi:hypothetical protein